MCLKHLLDIVPKKSQQHINTNLYPTGETIKAKLHDYRMTNRNIMKTATIIMKVIIYIDE